MIEMKPGPYHHLAALVRQKRDTAVINYRHFEPETIAGLQAEAVKARLKHPEAVWMLAALMEEVGEIAKAINDDAPIHEIRKEALHVAVVALRTVEEGLG
jgi:hypothetical protein